MAIEIEHKYLVKGNSYQEMAKESVMIRQGYLSTEPARTVRIRTLDNRGFITIKGKTTGAVRKEYEYSIPYEDAMEMLAMCRQPILEKRRYYVDWKGKRWEIDEFQGGLKPLVLAEIELTDPDEQYDIPPFAGENVTGDPRYYNSNLSC